MNKDLYEKLGIDSTLELKDLLEAIENKQGEYLQRAETASSEERKQELELLISKMDDEIDSLKKEIKAAKVSKKVENLKQADKEKKEKEKQAKELKQKREQEKQEQEKRKQQVAANKTNNPAPVNLRNMSNTSEQFQSIINDYYDRFYPEVISALKPMAEANDSSAQYVLGVMYQNGLGTKQDLDRAKFWLKKASDAGEYAASGVYSKCILQDSKSSDKEKKDAFKRLEIASNNNDYFAMEEYVDACLTGVGGTKEIGKAIGYCSTLKDVKQELGFEVSKNILKRMKKEDNAQLKTSFNIKKILIRLLIILAIVAVVVLIIKKAKSSSNDISNSEKAIYSDVELQVVINVDDANVRVGPGTENNVLEVANEGDVYIGTGDTAQSDDGHLWYEVYINDQYDTGWISEKVSEIIE